MKTTKLTLSAVISALILGGCAIQPYGNSAAMVPPAMVPPVEENNPSTPEEPTTPTNSSTVADSSMQQKEEMVHNTIKKEAIKRPELIKINGIGYGSESTYEAYTPGQRRLMAIRASKLDAYRSLAEQLSGIKIDSNTSVATLTSQSDSFRARVSAIVRGARVVSITPMADHNYETVLEVYVDRSFFDNVFVYTAKQNPEATLMSPGGLCANGNCQ